MSDKKKLSDPLWTELERLRNEVKKLQAKVNKPAADPQLPIPQAIDAEKALLGSVMLAPNRVLDELHWLKPGHFHHPSHETIFARMLTMRNEGVPIDLITLTRKLEDALELDGVGGAGAVTDLFTYVPSASNAEYYADIINEKRQRRGMIEIGEHLARTARFDEVIKPEDLLDECEKKLLELRTDTSYISSLKPISETLEETVAEIEERIKNKGKTMGLQTGFNDLDRMLDGLQEGNMVIVGARPGVGKTSLLLQMAVTCAQQQPVAIYSMEMTTKALEKRLLFMDCEIDLRRIRDGFVSGDERDRLSKSYCKFKGMPIWIDETPALSIIEFRASARRAVHKLKVKAIFIDYLQLMRSTSKRAQENRVIEVTEISLALKALAKELKVPIVLAAQLNRNIESRGANPRPKLSDLKESGQIEQDADIVVLLHRVEANNTNHDGQELAEFIIAKNREGATTKAKQAMEMGFMAKYTRFENLTDALWSNDPRKRQGYKKDKAREAKEEQLAGGGGNGEEDDELGLD